MDQFLSIFLVVWRETFEALLVIFLLGTRLARENLWTVSKKYLVTGILAGISLSLLCAFVLFKVEALNDSWVEVTLSWSLPLVASLMMAHMVFWMSKHGREISGEIQHLVENKKSKVFFWGIAGFIAYSVAREGFETVIFLYGLSLKSAAQGQGIHFALPAAVGFAVSLLTVYIFEKGFSFFNLKYFFMLTNVFLLGTSISLFVSAINKLIELEYLPSLQDPLWDSSHLIPATSVAGKVLNAVMGYTPQPSMTLVISYVLFLAAMTTVYLKMKASTAAKV